jgi:hypothetical protein
MRGHALSFTVLIFSIYLSTLPAKGGFLQELFFQFNILKMSFYFRHFIFVHPSSTFSIRGEIDKLLLDTRCSHSLAIASSLWH